MATKSSKSTGAKSAKSTGAKAKAPSRSSARKASNIASRGRAGAAPSRGRTEPSTEQAMKNARQTALQRARSGDFGREGSEPDQQTNPGSSSGKTARQQRNDRLQNVKDASDPKAAQRRLNAARSKEMATADVRVDRTKYDDGSPRNLTADLPQEVAIPSELALRGALREGKINDLSAAVAPSDLNPPHTSDMVAAIGTGPFGDQGPSGAGEGGVGLPARRGSATQ